jgi:hypothetical protein
MVMTFFMKGARQEALREQGSPGARMESVWKTYGSLGPAGGSGVPPLAAVAADLCAQVRALLLCLFPAWGR